MRPTRTTMVKLLGLSARECRVLMALRRGRGASTSAIARDVHIPRTTTREILRRLRQRGLAHVSRSGTSWAAVSDERLWRMFAGRTTPGIGSNTPSVSMYCGLKRVMEAYEKMFELGRTERVYFIQGNGAAEANVTRLGDEATTAFTQKFKNAHLILEGITGEKIFRLFPQLNQSKLRAHFGRMLVLRTLPDDDMDFNVDIVTFRDTVIFGNIQKERAVVIHDKDIATALRHITRIAQRGGRTTDLNAFLRGLLTSPRRRQETQT